MFPCSPARVPILVFTVKICVISTPVFKFGVNGCAGYAGLEQLAWQRAKGLALLGHEVYLAAPDGSTCPGVHVIETGPERQVNEAMAFEKYKNHLPQMDVVIDDSWEKWSLMLKQEGKLNIPVLGVCHAPVNTMYQSLPQGVTKPCFVCISNDQAKHFEAIFGREAKVIYNGVDLDFYKNIGVPRTDRYLFLARFSTIKGADLAIEACRQAGVGLDLVGDTTITHEPEFFQKCASMCDGKQIRMVGPATRSECIYWFSQAKALLHPNQRFREPFGLAPVEALACGTPVIAWNYGAMKETIPHGEEGFVCDCPGTLVNSLEEMVKQIKEWSSSPNFPYQKQSENLRKWAGKFSEKKMIDRCQDLCAKAVKTGGW